MKLTSRSFIIVVLLLVTSYTTALAQGGDPVGGCPDSFHLHQMMDHDDHSGHMHHHVGNDKDQNGDGYLCVKHVGKDGINHVHIDNNIPLN